MESVDPFGGNINYSLFYDPENSIDYFYNQIRTSIFDLKGEDCTDSFIKGVKEKHETNKLNELILKFKSEIYDLYNRRVIKEKEYYDNKLELDLLTSKFMDLINYLNVFETKREINEDSSITSLLSDKLKEYSKLITIDPLKKEVDSLNNEMFILKESINSYLSIQHPCICSICLEKQIKYFIDPCGHTLCEKCKDQINDSCYYCRTKIIQFKKLYIL
jgi:hypothetical protein